MSADATPQADPNRSPWLKLALLAAVLAGVALAVRYTGFAEYVTVGRLRALRESAGSFAPLLFVLAYIAGTVVSFPGIILSLSGGLLFGTLMGGTYIVIGATIGAIGAFLVSRFAGREAVERFVAGGLLERFDRSVSGAGLSAVLFTRLVPLFPFNVVNFAWGLTSVRLRDYAIGTAVGIVPAAFVYANLAGAVGRSLEGTDGSLASVDVSRLLNGDVLLAFGLLGALAVAAPLVRTLWNRSSR
jgi:uncharacterized membrane protein YdjX (TVP38/TMEM64 family)